jgi:hypothetical protein
MLNIKANFCLGKGHFSAKKQVILGHYNPLKNSRIQHLKAASQRLKEQQSFFL